MTIRKGESLFYDFEKDGGEIIDVNDESSIYEIRDDKTNSVLYTGSCDIVNNMFQLRLTSIDTDAIAPGTYVLLVAFINSVLGYKDYILDEPLQVIK